MPRKPEIHKRLIIVASTILLIAAVLFLKLGRRWIFRNEAWIELTNWLATFYVWSWCMYRMSR